MESSLDRSPSVGTQTADVEAVVIPDSVHPDVVSRVWGLGLVWDIVRVGVGVGLW